MLIQDQKKFPLFMIDLNVVDGQVAYMTPLKAFEEKIIALYTQALGQLQVGRVLLFSG